MDAIDQRTRSWLVVDAGFSKENAEIAIGMLRRGELSEKESKLLWRVVEGRPNTYARDQLGKDWEILPASLASGHILDKLNYRITMQHGGKARNGRRRGI